MKKRKLKWYGHISGQTDSPRRSAREQFRVEEQKDRKNDGLTTLASGQEKDFATTQGIVHDHKRWRQLVQRSTQQCPYDPEKG